MFEIHITTHPLDKNGVEQFRSFCHLIKAKPIIIELQAGQVTQQPMISKRYHSLVEGQIHEEIEKLKTAFQEHGYTVERIKVEVPVSLIQEGKKEFVDYKGQYFEWHGKVEFDKLENLENALQHYEGHISRNSLKDEPNKRIVTVRSIFDKQFYDKVADVKQALKRARLKLIKEEHEYCIFDSNKAIDAGWSDIPEITDENYLNLLAFEGFLRRASYTEDFILKGSLLTRQYIKNKNDRHALDLDFVYAKELKDQGEAEKIFSKWATAVTQSFANDGVKYTSFQENKFWRGIDYAMDDDFPTTNTDLSCAIPSLGANLEYIGLDISWNLPLDEDPIPLMYYPEIGDPFMIPLTIPLPTQIAWKLHQSIVRPRVKDMADIILLLENNPLSPEQVDKIAEVFSKECIKDEIHPKRILAYTENKISTLFEKSFNKTSNQGKYIDILTPFGFEFYTNNKLESFEFAIDFGMKSETEVVKAFENALNGIPLKHAILKQTKELPSSLKKKLSKELKKIEKGLHSI